MEILSKGCSMGKEVWHPDKIGFTHNAWLPKRVSYFPHLLRLLAWPTSSNAAQIVYSNLNCALLIHLLSYNHSGRNGRVNFLNGPMGIANAQRGLEYIRVVTEFISYVVARLFTLCV